MQVKQPVFTLTPNLRVFFRVRNSRTVTPGCMLLMFTVFSHVELPRAKRGDKGGVEAVLSFLWWEGLISKLGVGTCDARGTKIERLQ